MYFALLVLAGNFLARTTLWLVVEQDRNQGSGPPDCFTSFHCRQASRAVSTSCSDWLIFLALGAKNINQSYKVENREIPNRDFLDFHYYLTGEGTGGTLCPSRSSLLTTQYYTNLYVRAREPDKHFSPCWNQGEILLNLRQKERKWISSRQI